MPGSELRPQDKQRRSLTEIIAAGGPMDERKAMGIARTLCSRLMDETGAARTDLTAFHPNTIMLSSGGTISFSEDVVPASAREAYLPPEYVKGTSSEESVIIYAMGMLLLFLVTGQEKKAYLDTGVRNGTLKNVINRCTALDSRRRYQSLMEVRSALGRELFFPRRFMKRLLIVLSVCLAAGASLYLYLRARSGSEDAGRTAGYQSGYRNGYEDGVSDAPGIGIEKADFPEEYGGLPGNLNSKDGAFAVTGGDWVYFTCEGRVYRMDPYSLDTLLVASHEEIRCLNYWQGYLFYLTEDALVRLDTATGQEEAVTARHLGRFSIYEGTLYLDDEMNPGSLYGIDAVSLRTKQLSSDSSHAHLAVADGKLFYTDPERDGSLFSSDYDGGSEIRLLSGACRDIDLCGGRIWFLTAGKKGGEPDQLVSMSTEGGGTDVLTVQPVSRFVAETNGIFYIAAPNGNLEWMTPDGKTRYTVSTEEVLDFNLAGRWIFYRVAGDRSLYRMRIDGSDSERVP